MKNRMFLAAAALSLSFCTFVHADEFDDAKDKVEKFLAEYEDIRNLKPHEVKSLITAICGSNGEKDDFESLSREAVERVRDEIRDRMDHLVQRREEADKALEPILHDEKFTDRKSDAEKYSDRIREIWARVEKLYDDEIRGGNNPTVAYLRKLGQDSHADYQDHSGYCTEREVETSEGNIDCLNLDKCWVIELKPNNNRAVDKGKDQAEKYANSLNKDDGGHFSDLVRKNSNFSKCSGKFEPKVSTYVACPDVNDDGTVKSLSYGWSDPRF
jgi:Restriction endonuclease fold toxin 9